MRRLRKENLRFLVRETKLSVDDFIVPIFVDENFKKPLEISSMPNYFRIPLDSVVKEIEACLDKNLKTFILFGIPSYKDEVGTSAYDKNGVIQRALRSIKSEFDDVVLITDVCLCEYTSHGHCGIVKGTQILNDETLPLLAKIAISHAEAGANIVAPSAMMDGMVKAI